MKHLQSYKIFESNSKENLINFLESLKSELENMEFELNYSFEDEFLDIGKSGVGTYLSFDLSNFDIEDLKKQCIDRLDSNKSDWKCSDTIKDDYDLLCTGILVFIDEYNNI